MENKSPLFSVIVPLYNREDTIHRCIVSVLEQQCEDFQLILVDDGSTDGSGRICDEFAAKDSRIKVIHQRNGGVSKARKQGLKCATGKWITFLDSDDWFTPDYLSDFAKVLCDDKDFYVCCQKNMRNGAVTKYRIVENMPFLQCFVKSGVCNVLGPVAKIYRNSIIQQHNIFFDEQMRNGEDHLFILNYLCFCSTLDIVNAVNYIQEYSPAGLDSVRKPYAEEINAVQKKFKGALQLLDKCNATAELKVEMLTMEAKFIYFRVLPSIENVERNKLACYIDLAARHHNEVKWLRYVPAYGILMRLQKFCLIHRMGVSAWLCQRAYCLLQNIRKR